MSTIYNVFDKFLRVETWHTSHACDDRRFYECLHEVVEETNFDPEAMGSYMRNAKGVDSDEHPYAERIRELVSNAWAVREYLAVAGLSAYDDPDSLV